MTARAFEARERRKVLIERLQVAAFSAILTSAFFFVVVVLFQFEALVGGMK